MKQNKLQCQIFNHFNEIDLKSAKISRSIILKQLLEKNPITYLVLFEVHESNRSNFINLKKKSNYSQDNFVKYEIERIK